MKTPTKFSNDTQVINYLDYLAGQYNDGMISFNEFLVATNLTTKHIIEWQIEKTEAALNILRTAK